MKIHCFALAAIASVPAFADGTPAVPTVANVIMTQTSTRRVTISYDLKDAPAVVTVDFETNTLADATGDWVSIGGENVSYLTGDANRRVEAGTGKKIRWNVDRSWPGRVVEGAGVRAKLTAWALDDTPDYMVVDLATDVTTADRVKYYTSASYLPGGLFANADYRTTKLVMRKVRAKNVEWTMGTTSESGRSAHERSHQVTLDHNYYIAVFQITQGQWRMLDPSTATPDYQGAMRAMNYVSYLEIRESKIGKNDHSTDYMYPNDPHGASFLGVLNGRTGLDFDLPWESEWEYACRAGHGEGLWGDGSQMSGDATDNNLPGRYGKNVGEDLKVAVVGSYAPNSWGIYDMHGNVREYCVDYYKDDITSLNGAVNTTIGSTGRVIIRGGDWHESDARKTRSGYRDDASPSGRANYTGFRVACRAGLK